ncbi:MAG TPA: pyrroline-5-carboxylate reductase [Planctomicrobium sp.]|nr:pyrroline-5-carboxylate reductase [Planctomicrobium sp.]
MPVRSNMMMAANCREFIEVQSSRTKQMSNQQVRVGFIGAGKMATALAKGLIEARFTSAEQIVASDVYSAARDQFTNETGSTTFDGNSEVLQRSQVIILAVKPQSLSEVFTRLKEGLTTDHLIVSIAAGVTLSKIEAALPGHRVIRVMPNTPCLVGAGASAFARGSHATSEDAALVQRLLATVGLALEVPESQLDAVTGLSGSGPAYVFEIIEALSDGGVLAGLPRATATKLAAQTLLGAAKMVLETGEHPGQLKDAVTSPAGTTIAGLLELEQAGIRGSLMNAVRAATQRARELA